MGNADFELGQQLDVFGRHMNAVGCDAAFRKHPEVGQVCHR